MEQMDKMWGQRGGGQTLFFYDLETSGLRPREDRVMQFAGQRCTLELAPVGEPVNILVRMTEDALPSPGAIMVTKITPQQTLADGITEAEFCRYLSEEVFVPGTVALGFNTVRFDDEFMRALWWRNFYDPYEWEWKDGRSRWDMLDVVRLTRALRPEGMEWPFTEEGKPTNRLELLTKANGLSHEHAHDALSDVYATIAVAKMIREKQPEMWNYLYNMREKRAVQQLVNLETPRPVVYASGRYANEYNKTTVVVPVAPGRNGNVLVYDLRYDPVEVATGGVKTEVAGRRAKAEAMVGRAAKAGANGEMRAENGGDGDGAKAERLFPIVKELCYNKCPAVAPLGVLEKGGGWEKIGLTQEQVERNWRMLRQHPEVIERARVEQEERLEWPPAAEPEAALYDGFLNDADRVKVAAVRNADAMKLADFHPGFDDPRLEELLLHYKGRNFPESLSEAEAIKWEECRRQRLERLAPKFVEELSKVYNQDEFVGEELKLYFENLLATDY